MSSQKDKIFLGHKRTNPTIILLSHLLNGNAIAHNGTFFFFLIEGTQKLPGIITMLTG